MLNFILIFDLDDTIYQKHGVVADDYSGIENIRLYPGAREFLEYCQDKFFLILVTKGDSAIQNKKIDLLKIREQFKQIMICKDGENGEDKKSCFLKIKKEFPESKIVVIGDKLQEEIRYGNELGMITIRIKKGKYEHEFPQEESEIPKYVINDIITLEKLLNVIIASIK